MYRMLKITTSASLALIALVTFGAQGEWPNNPNADPCYAGSGLGQAECASRQLLRTEEEMKIVYARLLENLPKGDDDEFMARSHLVKSQEAWLLYMKESCGLVGAMSGGGTLRPALELNCAASATKERIDELRGYLLCAEGGDCKHLM
jgi:uncharacterized protein YecT (DUF1311 family)